jgi:hypothetical protein
MHTNIQQQRDHGCGDAPCCICCRHSPNKPAKEEEEATLFQRQLKRSLPFLFSTHSLSYSARALSVPAYMLIDRSRQDPIRRPGPAIRVVVE